MKMTIHIRLFLFYLHVCAGVRVNLGQVCNDTTDSVLCNSVVCVGFHWCDICDRCMHIEDAVFYVKEEL